MGELDQPNTSPERERHRATVLLQQGASNLPCSGVVVSPRVVLTAAHCVQSFDAMNPNTTRNILISYDTDGARDGATVSGAGTVRGRCIMHPRYAEELGGDRMLQLGPTDCWRRGFRGPISLNSRLDIAI